MLRWYGFLCLVVLASCIGQQPELVEESGMRGTIYHGAGGCGEGIGVDGREYQPYSGFLYFLDKAELEQHLSTADDVDAVFAHIKGHSFMTWVGYGNLDAQVPVGDYIIATRDVLDILPEFLVRVEAGEMVEKDLWFWKCVES